MKYLIVYPEERWVTAEELISQARDDIANGDSSVAERPEDVTTVEDAIAVLNDSGSMTVSTRTKGEGGPI